MAAVMRRTEVGVREFGTTVTIPTDPRARLMYYLDCMCIVLDLSDQSNLTRLRDYRAYYSLTDQEIDSLIVLCGLLSPTTLLGKVIFQDDAMCTDSNNQFFEISAVRNNLIVSESIIIGGQQRHITKIMAYKQIWMLKNWVEPMLHFKPRLDRLAAGRPGAPPPVRPPVRPAIQYQRSVPPPRRREPSSPCCTIL